jgi:Domain of unknown function (DUF4105)
MRRQIQRAIGNALQTLRSFSWILFLLLALGLSLWAIGALYFMLPVGGPFGAAAFAFVVLVVLVIIRPLWKSIAILFGLFLLVFAWSLTIRPSNDRPWDPEVAQTAWAEINGDQVIIHNFRDFDYRTATEFTPHWGTKTLDLSQIKGIDLFINYWGSTWMAHPIVSFPIGDDDHVAFSIELRKQVNQKVSMLGGLYKIYGLIYLVGTERDLVRLRTNYRHEDIYLYRTTAKAERARAMFLDYLRSLNDLHQHPQFYNALTSNCTTNVRVHAVAAVPGEPPPWDWRILINGFADQMLYERGDFVGDRPFADLKKQALINERAKAADQDPEFSRDIRKSLVGFEK